MGRHTASIPIVETQTVGPVTDPRLFDAPLPSAMRIPSAPETAEARAPQQATDDLDDDVLDGELTDIDPRSARSVLEAESRSTSASTGAAGGRWDVRRTLTITGASLAALIGGACAALLLR